MSDAFPTKAVAFDILNSMTKRNTMTEKEQQKAANEPHQELPDEQCRNCKHKMVSPYKDPCLKCCHMDFLNLENHQSYYE
jgi:hypothetical protein